MRITHRSGMPPTLPGFYSTKGSTAATVPVKGYCFAVTSSPMSGSCTVRELYKLVSGEIREINQKPQNPRND
jgi:hypothetical protein